MSYNPNIHHRRSIRLKGYDYSQAGLYFITICAQDRACLFGYVSVGAPLVGAQNDGSVQNETVCGNDDGRMDDDGQIGRPQGHAPTTVAQICDPNETDVQNDGVQNDGSVRNDGTQNVGTTHTTMILNDAGKMVETEWLKLMERFPNIELHEYVVMPNHFHSILKIVDTDVGRPQGHAPTNTPTNKTVGDMLDAFKSITTVEYIHGVKQSGWKPFNRKLWQRDYWEHIIRDEQEYQRISAYIINNPAKWKGDKFYYQ